MLPNVHHVGRSFRLSPLDIIQANLLYNCPCKHLFHFYILFIPFPFFPLPPSFPPPPPPFPPPSPLSSSPSLSPTNPSITDIRNVIPPGHASIPSTPSQNNSFLIQNKETSSCLASTPERDPGEFSRYSHEVLYSISLVLCDSSSATQRWVWTDNNTLLHQATYLCLAIYHDVDTKKLVLRTCKEFDLEQKWSCNGHYIEQVDSQECMRVMVSPSEKVHVEKKPRSVGQDSLPDVSTMGSSVSDLTAELENEIELQAQSTHTGRTEAGEQEAGGVDAVDTSHVVTFENCSEAGAHVEWNIVGYVGEEGLGSDSSICSPTASQSHSLSTCYVLDMEPLSTVSFRTDEWAVCSHPGYYVSGFYHTFNINFGNLNFTGLISGVKCCAGDYMFTVEPGAPATEPGGDVCYEMTWWDYTTYVVHEGWFTCPRGMLLKGLMLSAKPYQRDDNIIKWLRCCKPKLGPKEYTSCYTTNSTSVGDTWAHTCHLDGFQVAGLFRKNCNEYGIMCEEEITCCMMG